MAVSTTAPYASDALERVRLAERLAIVDEVHDDVAHGLAIAAIHLGLLDPDGRGRAAGAPGVAQVGCQRALDGLRRARRMAVPDARPSEDPEAVAADLGHLEALATDAGARAAVATPQPAAAELEPGVLVTTARIAEAFLRITERHGAILTVSCAGGSVCVEVTSALAPGAWVAPHPDVERVRERVRWFDGRLTSAPHGAGSRAVAQLPC